VDNSQKKRIHKLSVRSWIALRKFIQTIVLLVFLFYFISSQHGGLVSDLPNEIMRLDPLTALAQSLAKRAPVPGLLLAAGMIVVAIIFGRAWCGWLCPLGTLIDWISPHKNSKGNLFSGWRRVKYFLALVILISALFGSLTFLFLDPLTILFRSLTSAIWPALDRVISAIEGQLLLIPFLQEFVSSLDSWLRPAVFPNAPLFYQGSIVIMLFLVAIFRIVNRFWCRYLCPLGGVLGLIGRYALFQRSVAQECHACGVCVPRCPTGTIDPERGYSSDPAECTLCLDCLGSCPQSSMRFGFQMKSPLPQHYDPDRRMFLGALLTAGTSVALMKVFPAAAQHNSHLLRSPGVDENTFLSTCIRCSACIRACPTAALQLALAEGGLESMLTPILVPRQGYCDYSCTACGNICPVGAIPRLPLDVKRQQVIGKAYIDKNRCIAWANHQACIVCEEMCPISEKAIQLDLQTVILPGGSTAEVKVPHIVMDRCIGCGICEYKCPVTGEAAIRVYLENDQGIF
jgi:ferredoxin